MDTTASWRDQIMEQRQKKDRYFGENSRSPLPPEERETFEGLHYL